MSKTEEMSHSMSHMHMQGAVGQPQIEVFIDQPCPICEVQQPVNSMISIASCPHRYCPFCLLSHIRARMNSMANPSCPQQDCEATLTTSSFLYDLLLPEEQAKFHKLELTRFLLAHPEFKACKEPSCVGRYEVAALTCTSCSSVHCSLCHQLKHQGTCLSDVIVRLQNIELFKRCGRCSNMVERNGGCLHMTCICGFEFCYKCAAPYQAGHICPPLSFYPQMRWDMLNELKFYECEGGFAVKHIYKAVRLEGRDGDMCRFITFLILAYPLLVLVFLALTLAASAVFLCMLLVLMLFSPFLLIFNMRSSPQRSIAECSKCLALLLVVLFYPIFLIISIVLLSSDFRLRNSPFYQLGMGFLMVLLLPCFILQERQIK